MKVLRELRWWVDVFLLLAVLPLGGMVVFGRLTPDYLEFPPRTQYVEHPGFSWLAFVTLAIFTIVVVGPFVWRVIRSTDGPRDQPVHSAKFPLWGWVGVVLTACGWLLAWTRFEWFAPLQMFTYIPLWYGYIIMVNALVYRRTGHCHLRDRPGYFVGLLALSAVFWWYFEYLNRFVQNWHYQGIGETAELRYFMLGTLSFSTVLPAVLGTLELLKSYPRLTAGLDNFVRIRISHPRILAGSVLLAACIGLALIGRYPSYLFPLLWVSPLLVITSIQALRGGKTVFAGVAHGDWRSLVLSALAALICGVFWEVWNTYSLAKWVYSVPFVNRFRIGEMPLLGFTGYLPFGLECVVVAGLLGRRTEDGRRRTDDGGRKNIEHRTQNTERPSWGRRTEGGRRFTAEIAKIAKDGGRRAEDGRRRTEEHRTRNTERPS